MSGYNHNPYGSARPPGGPGNRGGPGNGGGYQPSGYGTTRPPRGPGYGGGTGYGGGGQRNDRRPPQSGHSLLVKRENCEISLTASRFRELQVGSVTEYALARNPNAAVNTRAEQWAHGDVVIAPYVVPGLNSEALNTHEDIAISTIVGPISAKMRPHIVIGILDNIGLVAMPLFSSTKRGCASVPSNKRHECMPVLSKKAIEEKIDGIKPGQVVRSANDMKWVPTEGSFVCASLVNMLDYKYPIRRVGLVDPASLRRLQNSHDLYLQKSYRPLSEQEAFVAKAQGVQPPLNNR